MYRSMYVCVCVCVYVCMYICMCMHVCMHVLVIYTPQVNILNNERLHKHYFDVY